MVSDVVFGNLLRRCRLPKFQARGLEFPQRGAQRSSKLASVALYPNASRSFATTRYRPENRIYDPVRDSQSLHTLLLLSSSSQTALITLWKTSWCKSCATVAPLIQSIIESSFNISPTSTSGGRSVGYAEVELDAPDMAEMGQRYSITSVPTLMSFSRQEAQLDTRVTDLNNLKNEAFMKAWIEEEARRGGSGGAGGSLFGRFRG